MNSKQQIARNAIFLYIRMFICLLLGLYSSRVILRALGVQDYGIYNVVGSFVALFSLISGSLRNSVSRFLTFELGTGDKNRLTSVFSTSLLIMLILGVIVFVFAEIFGVWYIENKMVLPKERTDAAFWVLQFSLASFVVSLINTPYSASIISHERMDLYAYLSVFDSICKLAICILVSFSSYDRLIFYSILLFVLCCICQLIYYFICSRCFVECRWRLTFNKELFHRMTGFAGWNFIGSSAAILRTQGASLLLNSFGGPLVNAANGIANSICGVVTTFVDNFSQAFNPQITKNYASKNYTALNNMLLFSSKFSFFLMLLLTLPIFLNANFILNIWLGIVPDHSVSFARWMLLYLLLQSLSAPIITAKNATGQIRNYQIVVGGILLLMLPISYIGLRLGATVEFVFIANLVTAFAAFIARIIMLRGDFGGWSSLVFFRSVVCRVYFTSFVASILPFLIYSNMEEGWIRFVVTSSVSIVSTLFCIYYLGMNQQERDFLLTFISQRISFLRKVQ